MEQTLETLNLKVDQFNDEQKKLNEQLEQKKDTVIIKNNNRKKAEEKKYLSDRLLNENKEKLILSLEQKETSQQQELQSLQNRLEKYRIYEQFLIQVEDNFGTEDHDQPGEQDHNKRIQSLINRHKILQKNHHEF